MIQNLLNAAIPVYKGVYMPGQTYERSDIVTFGGSMYHCNTETKVAPGNGGTDWTLAVKKGRDAKEVSADQIQGMVDTAVAAAVAKLSLTVN